MRSERESKARFKGTRTQYLVYRFKKSSRLVKSMKSMFFFTSKLSDMQINAVFIQSLTTNCFHCCKFSLVGMQLGPGSQQPYLSAFLEFTRIMGRWASVGSELSSSSVRNLLSGRIWVRNQPEMRWKFDEITLINSCFCSVGKWSIWWIALANPEKTGSVVAKCVNVILLNFYWVS